MSGAAFGARLKDEVITESLDEILRQIRPPRPPPHHPLLTPPTTHRQQQPSRLPVVELAGASCSGKTHLVYTLASSCALSQEHPSAVLIFDTDGRFDIDRFRQVMLHAYHQRQHLQQQQQQQRHQQEQQTSQEDPESVEDKDNAPNEAENAVSMALHHIHIFRPTSTASLLSTLTSLPTYLLASRASRHHDSGSLPLGAIVLDSASAFYWPDRLAAEDAAVMTSSSSTNTVSNDGPADEKQAGADETTYVTSQRRIIQELRALQTRFECAVLVTSWVLGPDPARRGHLSGAWRAFCTRRVLVGREEVPRFVAEMGVLDAARDRVARQDVVKRARFYARDVGGVGEDAARDGRDGGVFGFRVLNRGVVFDGDGDGDDYGYD
ncbi:MAG: hypothetical protein M1825_006190 [Sarcosagium campestre]|nr:MAG: hypothetical protein M1825_006190 [Sarcosagium campestre]